MEIQIVWLEAGSLEASIKSSRDSPDECWTLICCMSQTGNCFLTMSANWGSVSDNMDCRCWNCTRGGRVRWKHNVYFPQELAVCSRVHHTYTPDTHWNKSSTLLWNNGITGSCLHTLQRLRYSWGNMWTINLEKIQWTQIYDLLVKLSILKLLILSQKPKSVLQQYETEKKK